MGTFSRSLALTKQSWSVLKANPQLALFPIISSVVSIFVIISFAIPVIAMVMTGHSNSIVTGPQGHEQMQPIYYVLTFCYYLVSYFVVIFFNAGLISCASEIFAGRPATFKDGIRNSFNHFGSIFVYALIAATVGMALRLLSERMGFVGKIVIALLGAAWSLITYFVAPILVLENKNPIAAIRESGAMLRRTWGENVVVNGSLHLAMGLLALVAMIPLVLGIVMLASASIALGIALIIGAVLFLTVIALISSTLTGVFQTALYLY